MIKFGTGGWRAIIGDEFIKSNIVTLAQAVADEINDRGCGERGIVIGYDRRFLSDRAAQWIAEVMAANRVTVHYINRISPTPLVMYGVKTLDTLYGMAVTASHNPAEYNGVKIFTVGGRDADQATTDAFEARISAGVKVKSMDFDKGVADGRIRLTDLYNAYLDSIISMINMDVIRMRRMRILLDPMFGVSKTALQTVLITARCDVDIINDRHDTLFGGKLPSPSAHTLTKLANMVVDEGYDLGIGTDGDADRIGIIDEKGVFVHPNEILMLLYYYLLKYKGWRGDVVRNIATTHVLDRIAQDFGQTCHEVPVGFKHISAKMEETDAVIGGESSGGLDDSRPHPRQGWHFRLGAPRGDDLCHRQAPVGASGGNLRKIRQMRDGGIRYTLYRGKEKAAGEPALRAEKGPGFRRFRSRRPATWTGSRYTFKTAAGSSRAFPAPSL